MSHTDLVVLRDPFGFAVELSKTELFKMKPRLVAAGRLEHFLKLSFIFQLCVEVE